MNIYLQIYIWVTWLFHRKVELKLEKIICEVIYLSTCKVLCTMKVKNKEMSMKVTTNTCKYRIPSCFIIYLMYHDWHKTSWPSAFQRITKICLSVKENQSFIDFHWIKARQDLQKKKNLYKLWNLNFSLRNLVFQLLSGRVVYPGIDRLTQLVIFWKILWSYLKSIYGVNIYG